MPAAGAGRYWVAADGGSGLGGWPFCMGDQPWRPGAGEEGSQPYLGARGAGAAPATRCLIGCPRLRGCGRSVLLGRPPGLLAARARQQLTGGLQELAAVVPHRVSVAAGVPAPEVRRVLGVASMRGCGLSGGGERVVAELGQDVA